MKGAFYPKYKNFCFTELSEKIKHKEERFTHKYNEQATMYVYFDGRGFQFQPDFLHLT